jgi:hypothetical protein
VDVKQVDRELGVGYVLEGSMRKAGPCSPAPFSSRNSRLVRRGPSEFTLFTADVVSFSSGSVAFVDC